MNKELNDKFINVINNIKLKKRRADTKEILKEFNKDEENIDLGQVEKYIDVIVDNGIITKTLKEHGESINIIRTESGEIVNPESSGTDALQNDMFYDDFVEFKKYVTAELSNIKTNFDYIKNYNSNENTSSNGGSDATDTIVSSMNQKNELLQNENNFLKSEIKYLQSLLENITLGQK